MKRVVVVGGGIAGTAAALAASRAGGDVRVVLGGSGASTLAPGALDDSPWEKPLTVAPQMEDGARAVLDALDAFVLPQGGAVVATVAGIVRNARGIERGLLDLGSLTRATVLVPALERSAWDGQSLARAWSDARAARERELTFVHAPMQLTRYTEEHVAPDADLAARHDDPARLAWLAAQVQRAVECHRSPVAAVLLPPWLGAEQERATALSHRVGVPCGEALTGAGGPSGLRYEGARDRALAQAKITTLHGWAVRVTHAEAGFSVELEDGEALEHLDAVVLAAGGLVGGGLAYTPAGSVLAPEFPPRARPLIRATVDAPVVVGAHGAPLQVPASLFGAAPESHAWPFVEDGLLDRAGVLVDRDGRVAGAPPGLFAAGELVADQPRTWLVALATGARAGAAAAQT
jgi:glycerol-3-phosphate dehydrogenase subunit B